eukprot:314232_1
MASAMYFTPSALVLLCETSRRVRVLAAALGGFRADAISVQPLSPMKFRSTFKFCMLQLGEDSSSDKTWQPSAPRLLEERSRSVTVEFSVNPSASSAIPSFPRPLEPRLS